MGLRQTISQWINLAKDTFDFGPEFPAAMAAHRREFVEELSKLRHLLEQTQKAAQAKDELIARLQATGMAKGNMVLDGQAYFIRKNNLLEGPFCTCCFQQNHEITRIVPAPRPEGAEEDSSNWVQCTQCRTPFQSQRISEYLNPQQTAPAQPAASPEQEDGEDTVPAARKPRSTTRRTGERKVQRTKATVRTETDRSQ